MGALPRTTINPWQTRASRIVYQTRWLRIREDEVITPEGRSGTWGVVELPHPVVLVAALDAQQRLYLVRQWRYAWNRDSWELPAGRGEAGEAPLASAQRELVEETGLRARTWTPLGTFFVSALMAVQFHFFLAQDLQLGAAARDGEEHDMIAQPVPLRQAVVAALDGTIAHAASISGILRVAHYLGQLHVKPDDA